MSRGAPNHVLVARLDSMGDVLLAGPAVRAIAHGGTEVTMLCSPGGAAAARLLPGVDRLLIWDCPWITPDDPPLTNETVRWLVRTIAKEQFDRAVILTSFHQSPLPLAMLLRLAGVPFIGGASIDHAGSLLDVRLCPGDDLPEEIPEPERALRIAAACGYPLPGSDDGRLAVTHTIKPSDLGQPYVVLHPGASAPARQWTPGGYAGVAEGLAALGIDVVVTGNAAERALTHVVARRGATDLGGRLSLARLAGVLAGAEVLVSGNTGPAHLAAAVGTPVVSLFSPVVPAVKWQPFGVPHVVLGDQDAACAGTRARVCPLPGHPCLANVSPAEVIDACLRLSPGLRAALPADRQAPSVLRAVELRAVET